MDFDEKSRLVKSGQIRVKIREKAQVLCWSTKTIFPFLAVRKRATTKPRLASKVNHVFFFVLRVLELLEMMR
jgi:hypothetical protein